MIRTERSTGSDPDEPAAEWCTEAAGPPALRVLCLGNDLLADDGIGPRVARALSNRVPPGVEVVESPETGFALLDHLLGVPRLVVIDAVVTGRAKPGTIYRLADGDASCPAWSPDVSGASPHYVGLFDALAAGRALNLPMADEVIILAVEAADVVTIGAGLSPEIEAMVPWLVEEVARLARL